MKMPARLALTLALLAAAATPAAAQSSAKPPSYPKPDVLLSTSTDTVGTPIRYPGGTPHVSAYLLKMVPGQSTGWHKHEVPLFARVLSGELAVDYGDKGSKTYRAGDSFMEAMGIWHDGHVVGDAPARLLVVFMGSDTAKNTVMKPAK